MGRLTYTALMSLDGYVADRGGRFDWATPDERVHALANELQAERPLQLYGRRMYEVMRFWQGVDPTGDGPAVHREFARLWQAADKIVFSTTMVDVSTPRSTLRATFDADEVRGLVGAAPHDAAVSGPTLAAAAFHAGLIDVVDLIVFPVTVGGGTPAFPPDLRLELRPAGTTALPGGVEHRRYRVTHL